MSLDLPPIRTTAEVPKKKNRLGFRLGVVGLIVVATLGVAKAWDSGYRPSQAWEARPVSLETVDVETGSLAVFINETGTLESAANTTVRCQVEALVGLVGGTATTKTQGAGGTAGSSGQGSGGAQASGTVATTAPVSSAASSKSGGGASKSSSKSSGSSSSSAKKKSTSSAGGSSGGSGSGGGGGGSGGSGGGGGGSGGGGGGGGGGMSGGGSGGSSGGGSSGKSEGSGSGGSQTPVVQRPTIRSFTYTVTPYATLRPATKAGASTQTKSASGMAGGGTGGNRGGGGGGGNRGGGGGGGMGGQQELPGSTRIIMIKPEGTPVSAGELVCELDSAAFSDEVIAQKIRFDQARAWLVQARSILEVNEISLREYRDGIYKQDLQLVRQYLSACRTEQERARRNLDWSKEVYLKGFRAPPQYQADILALERADIALGEAVRMERRLIDYTGPKLIKALEAKLEANKADGLAQEAAFQLESDRLKRLERMVENCSLRAPREGIVVYSMPPSNGWRPATAVIMEGATVREGQAIFELPDSKKMRVRARVNESKIGSIRVGQRASIRIDAFPDHDLKGTVTEVTAIPAPNGMGSDIRIYFANVSIDQGGFAGLRPGLSAQVSFFVDAHTDSVRVPVQAIRWADGTPYAAVTTSRDKTAWRWQPIEVGLINESFAEVLQGLKPGDKVVSHPETLAAPTPSLSPVLQAAGATPTPRG